MSLFLVNSDNEVEVESPGSGGGGGGGGNQPITEASQALIQFWPKVKEEIKNIAQLDVRSQGLPLARIKKIMKLDEEVKMISAEAPVLFAKAAELFIHELTLRAWIHTEDNKRRTLQRNDIAMAITKYDQFDFLIDIVPRDEAKPSQQQQTGGGGGGGGGCAVHGGHQRTGQSQGHLSQQPPTATLNADQVHYYFQLAQQHQAAMQGNNTNAGTGGGGGGPTPAAAAAPQTLHVIQPSSQLHALGLTHDHIVKTANNTAGAGSQPAVNNSGVQQIQLVQQVVTAAGEVQQIPIQLSPSQLQMIRMQLQNNSGHPIVIHTAPLQAQQVIQVAQQSAAPVFIQSAQATAGVTTSESE